MADADPAPTPAETPAPAPEQPGPATRERSRRGTFGPVVAGGLAAAALTAVGSTKAWFTDGRTSPGSDAAQQLAPLTTDAGRMPLAGALALLLLACWGVLLVTRGRVRRVLALLAVVVTLGVLATLVAGWVTLPDDVRRAAQQTAVSATVVHVSMTGWYWVSALGALASLAATVAALRLAPDWPEMGVRYDAPGTAEREVVRARAGEDTNLEVWKAIDEGQDPTRE